MFKDVIMSNYNRVPKRLLKLYNPKNIIVEPVAGCNLVCSACPSDVLKRRYGKMSMKTFSRIIDKIKPNVIGLYFMGEPLLNEKIFDMITYAKRNGVKVNMNTNGTLLYRYYDDIIRSRLDKLVVSIDGFSQEVFSRYRKGINSERVFEGLKYLSMLNSYKRLHIAVRILEFDNTPYEEITAIFNWCELNNITDVRVITPIITGWGGKVNPDLDVLGDGGRIKKGRPQVCPSLFRVAITWEGNVLPCCNDVHADNVYGNINANSYESIMWDGDMWKKKASRLFDICGSCNGEV